QVGAVADGGVLPPDGGTSSNPGQQPPPDGAHRSGCSSTSGPGLALLLAAMLALWRRRQLQRPLKSEQ
ncbi:MAG: hypothetical protein E6J88_16210, partial [Deltaproteobacteria bacterium]